MQNKTKKKITAVFAIISAIIMLLIVVLMLISSDNGLHSGERIGKNPEAISPSASGSEEYIQIRNVVVEDFDESGMGVMTKDKYYQLQYGVHLKDDSFIGERLGKTDDTNKLTAVEKDSNVYVYSAGASYLLEGNVSYYDFLGNDDVVLVDTVNGDVTIGEKWVMSPSLLEKTSLYGFFEKTENIIVTYYPSFDDISISYTIDNPKDFLSSVKRVPDSTASRVETGYITFDDGSGLLYGAMVYYDYDTGCSFLCPPSFPNLWFKADNRLGEYLARYLYEARGIEVTE